MKRVATDVDKGAVGAMFGVGSLGERHIGVVDFLEETLEFCLKLFGYLCAEVCDVVVVVSEVRGYGFAAFEGTRGIHEGGGKGLGVEVDGRALDCGLFGGLRRSGGVVDCGWFGGCVWLGVLLMKILVGEQEGVVEDLEDVVGSALGVGVEEFVYLFGHCLSTCAGLVVYYAQLLLPADGGEVDAVNTTAVAVVFYVQYGEWAEGGIVAELVADEADDDFALEALVAVEAQLVGMGGIGVEVFCGEGLVDEVSEERVVVGEGKNLLALEGVSEREYLLVDLLHHVVEDVAEHIAPYFFALFVGLTEVLNVLVVEVEGTVDVDV